MNLQEAVESYVFSLISLGAKIPATQLGIHELEDKVQNVFRDVLEDLVVCIHIDSNPNNIKITLV